MEMPVLAQSHPTVPALGKGLFHWVYLVFLYQPRSWTGYNGKQQYKARPELEEREAEPCPP